MKVVEVGAGVYRVESDNALHDVAVFIYCSGAARCEQCGGFQPGQRACEHVRAVAEEKP